MLAEQATPSQPVHFASQSCPQDAMSGFGQTANRQAVDDSQSSALDAARGFGYSSNQQFPQQGSQQAYQHQYPAPQYPQQYSNASSNQFPQQSQFISSSVPSYSSASQHGMPDPYNIGAYQHAYQQNSQSAQPASYHAQQHLQPTTSLHATPAQYMNGTYAQTPVQFAAHSQPSALSSQLSTASSVSSVAPSTASFAHTAIPQQQTGTSVFGSDYITGIVTKQPCELLPLSICHSFSCCTASWLQGSWYYLCQHNPHLCNGFTMCSISLYTVLYTAYKQPKVTHGISVWLAVSLREPQ